jgi:uncharacterized membrane protein YdfJ with MMPL/SSD domain
MGKVKIKNNYDDIIVSMRAEKTIFYITFVTCAKFIGAGLATIGLAGAGVGIGVLFAGF